MGRPEDQKSIPSLTREFTSTSRKYYYSDIIEINSFSSRANCL
ncbi:MAG: hypothetical protein ACTSWN_05950 [Promethearchaeota archaeon]